MKNLFCNSFATLILMLSIMSCENKTEKKPCHASWEMNIKSPHDTINKIDCNGLKQGKWIPSVTNKLKDTVFYNNDTVVN